MRIENSGVACFRIVSQSNFKTYDHLKLKLKQGGDEEIKKFLSSKLLESKEKIKALEQANQSSNDRIGS
jgi:hypothetical protein